MPTEPALSTLSMASQTSEDIYTKEGHNESSGVTRPSSPNTCKSTQIEPKLTEKIFSACSGAIVTSCLMTPFDVVKTRLQSQSLNIRPTGPTQASIVKINPSTMSTISQCAPNFFIPPATDGYCFCVQQFASSSQIQKSSTSCVFHGWNVGKPSVMGADGWRHFGRSSFGSSIERTLEGKEVIPKFNGTLDGMMQISRNEGLKSLWRGLSPTLVASIPSTVIYFVGYDYLRAWMGSKAQSIEKLKPLDDYTPLLAGCVARTCSATVISPLELIRTRMQSSASHDLKNVLIGVQGMIRSEGIGTLYRGLVPTLWRDVPFSAFYWFGYERIHALYKPLFTSRCKQSKAEAFVTSFAAGATSGIISATLTTPFDVAKTRRQVEASMGGSPQTIVSLLKRIVAEDGWRGAFSGLTPRLLKVAPACAIMISSYELGKHFFTRNNCQPAVCLD